jgi:solute carrier family 13 (sodium-dependent dicarboxylate transporter), member 2/3/5
LVGTGLNRIVLGFMAAAAFLSMWISNTATTMMLLPVGMAVVRQIAEESTLDGNKDETTKKKITKSLGLILMLGLAYSASIGGVGTLIGTAPNIVFAGFYKSLYPENEEISFVKWMMMAVPVVILFIPIVWVYLCRFVAPISLGRIAFVKEGKDIIKNELKALGEITRPEKMVAYVFAITALMWVFRKPLPLGSFIIPGWSNLFFNPEMLHDSTVAMVMGILLMLLPTGLKKGEVSNIQGECFLLDWNTVETRMPWGILLLFGGGFALASGVIKTGLAGWVGDQMSGLSVLPLWAVILTVCIVVTFLTEFTSNTATSTMILPLMGAAAVAASYHPLMFMLPATFSASFAFMLPVATPPNAIVFGSGWVTIPEMTRAGFVLNLIGATLITSLALLLIQSFIL